MTENILVLIWLGTSCSTSSRNGVNGDEQMKVTLDPWEHQVAYLVGMRREQANLHKTDARHYDRRRMEDNFRASLAAACCEAAVAKATCCYWTMSAWDSGQHQDFRMMPDILPNIEVKRIREPKNPLVVRRREVATNRLVVSAYAAPDYFRSVEIVGWLRAREAWELGNTAPYDPSGYTRLVEQSKLRSINELTADELTYE
jgi:hypothetical protein